MCWCVGRHIECAVCRLRGSLGLAYFRADHMCCQQLSTASVPADKASTAPPQPQPQALSQPQPPPPPQPQPLKAVNRVVLTGACAACHKGKVAALSSALFPLRSSVATSAKVVIQSNRADADLSSTSSPWLAVGYCFACPICFSDAVSATQVRCDRHQPCGESNRATESVWLCLCAALPLHLCYVPLHCCTLLQHITK